MTNPYGTSSPRVTAPASIAALAAAALLLATAPADAGGLSNSVKAGAAGSVGYYVKNLHEKIRGADGKMFRGFLAGDDKKVLEESRKLETIHAFPVLDPAHSIKNAVAAAKRKAVKAVNDVRAALAFDPDERKGGGSGAAILGGGPLPASTATAYLESDSEPKASHAGAPGAWTDPGTGRSQSWAEWTANEHRTRPHCYGIVDLENLPADCPNREAAAKLAASGAAGTGQASQVAGAGWGAGESAAKGGAWSEWDKPKGYVSDIDRESAQVSAFAVRCWGVSGVNEYHPFYPIMKKQMQRDDCLKEEAEGKLRDSSKKEYAAALADTRDEDGVAEGSGDYRDALTALEAREAERRQLEEEERERQARLAEKRRLEEEERERQARLAERRKAAERERRRQARLAEQRRNEEIEREYRRLNALEAEQRRQALRNIQKSLYNFARQNSQTGSGSGTVGSRSATSGSCKPWQRFVPPDRWRPGRCMDKRR